MAGDVESDEQRQEELSFELSRLEILIEDDDQ